ncbi:hypothetical protein ACNPPY_03440 [Achromobacter sp. AGC78]
MSPPSAIWIPPQAWQYRQKEGQEKAQGITPETRLRPTPTPA